MNRTNHNGNGFFHNRGNNVVNDSYINVSIIKEQMDVMWSIWFGTKYSSYWYYCYLLKTPPQRLHMHILRPYPEYYLVWATPSHLPRSSPTRCYYFIIWIWWDIPCYPYKRCHPSPLDGDRSVEHVDCCVVSLSCPRTSLDVVGPSLPPGICSWSCIFYFRSRYFMGGSLEGITADNKMLMC